MKCPDNCKNVDIKCEECFMLSEFEGLQDEIKHSYLNSQKSLIYDKRTYINDYN